jgi:ankyrin repeat protein
MVASQNGHIEVIKLIIKAGADVNAAATVGATSLMVASQNVK